MKKVYMYLSGFMLLSVMFTACYFFSYKSALNKFNQRAAEQNPDIGMTEVKEQSKKQQKSGESVQVDTAKIDTITPYTEYVLETYDVVNQKKITNQLNTPEFLIGLTRKDVIKYLNSYMIDIPLKEYEQGLVSFELVSFSSDKVILKKTYNSKNILFKYYIVVEEGMVVVYYSDKKTVYEYTGIEAMNLPEEEQIKLNYGIYVKDQEELYGILENYSS